MTSENWPILLFAAIGILLIAVGIAFAHGEAQWINDGDYKDPATGAHCCSANKDCNPYAPENVSELPSGYRLKTGETIPYTRVHDSLDGQYWRCVRHSNGVEITRCFFAPAKSY